MARHTGIGRPSLQLQELLPFARGKAQMPCLSLSICAPQLPRSFPTGQVYLKTSYYSPAHPIAEEFLLALPDSEPGTHDSLLVVVNLKKFLASGRTQQKG